MKFRNLVLAAVLLGAAIATLLASGHAGEGLPHAIQIWDNTARTSLPAWLYPWLAALGLTFLASLIFVRHSGAARWAAAGFLASHLTLVVIGVFELAVIRKGLVSLAHVVCWAPALVALLGALPSTQAKTPYGIWCRLLIFIIAVSFVFDIRDALMYLYYQSSGHPAL